MLARYDVKGLKRILWGIVIFNVISTIMFLSPWLYVYAIPKILLTICMIFVYYDTFGLALSGVVGVILTLILIMYGKSKKCEFQKQYVILLIIFLLTIPLGVLLFNIALSV